MALILANVNRSADGRRVLLGAVVAFGCGDVDGDDVGECEGTWIVDRRTVDGTNDEAGIGFPPADAVTNMAGVHTGELLPYEGGAALPTSLAVSEDWEFQLWKYGNTPFSACREEYVAGLTVSVNVGNSELVRDLPVELHLWAPDLGAFDPYYIPMQDVDETWVPESAEDFVLEGTFQGCWGGMWGWNNPTDGWSVFGTFRGC